MKKITDWLRVPSRRGRGLEIKPVAQVEIDGRKYSASPTDDLLTDLAKSWAGESGLEVLYEVELIHYSDGSETVLGREYLYYTDWTEYDSGDLHGYKATKQVQITLSGIVNRVKLKSEYKTYFIGSVADKEVVVDDIVKIEITLAAQQSSLSCTGLSSGNSCLGGATAGFSRACIGKIVGIVTATLELNQLTFVFIDDSTETVSTTSNHIGTEPHAFTVQATKGWTENKEIKELMFKNSSDTSILIDVMFVTSEEFDSGVTHTFTLKVTFSG